MKELAETRTRLEAAGIEDAAFEAAQLYALATGRDAYLADGPSLAPGERERLDVLCQKRCTRYPLQYLCGTWDFMDMILRVGPGVLIPRADTETVARAAILAARAAETIIGPMSSSGECRRRFSAICRMTGVSLSSAAASTPMSISMLPTLKAPAARFLSSASLSSVLNEQIAISMPPVP